MLVFVWDVKVTVLLHNSNKNFSGTEKLEKTYCYTGKDSIN